MTHYSIERQRILKSLIKLQKSQELHHRALQRQLKVKLKLKI